MDPNLSEEDDMLGASGATVYTAQGGLEPQGPLVPLMPLFLLPYPCGVGRRLTLLAIGPSSGQPPHLPAKLKRIVNRRLSTRAG